MWCPFAAQLDDRLRQMSANLLAGTISLGRLHQFVIRDPKERIIGAFRGEVGRGLPIGSLTSQPVGDQLAMVSVQAPSVSRRKPLSSQLTM